MNEDAHECKLKSINLPNGNNVTIDVKQMALDNLASQVGSFMNNFLALHHRIVGA